MNSLSSCTGSFIRPARQSDFACSILSRDDDTKFHSIKRTPTGSPPRSISTLGACASITVSFPLATTAIRSESIVTRIVTPGTITDSALGSALGALAALVASEVLVTLNAATVVQPYLPTRYWLAWIDFFRQPVFWRDIQRGFGIQAVYVVVFLAAAWANFSTKDITA